MFIFRKRAILQSVCSIWFSCFRSFKFRENVVQKTKGRSGQTKKTGFLLLFSLRFRYDYVRLNKQPFGLQHFAFESTSEIRPERICRRCKWPSSCHTWTCCCCTLNNFYKKSRRSVTCKLATLIWSSSCSFTRQQISVRLVSL